jgi:signal transduction histidine kinase
MPSIMAPARVMVSALLLAFALLAAAVGVATWQPWLGLQLRVVAPPGLDADAGHIEVQGATRASPAASMPAHARIVGIAPLDADGRLGPVMALQGDDLLEEPDVLDSYTEMRQLFARQERIAAMLRGQVLLHWLDAGGGPRLTRLTPAPWRPPHSLPPMFWFQLAVGALAWLLSVWVWVLRPQDWAARLLAAAGLLLLLTTTAAAVYSARELALPGGLFRGLSAINHLGAVGFGMSMVGVFMMYPHPMVPPSNLLLLPLVFLSWWVLDTWQVMPDQNWGGRVSILLEMMLAIAAAVVQWHRSRSNPADRAAMRWFNLSAWLGCTLFAICTVGPNILGLPSPIPQGYAFGFFIVLFGGLAFGVGRYRLFDLDRWAFRLLLWTMGAAGIVVLDLVLAWGLGFNPGASLALTLLVCGALYFPIRQWLWARMVQRPSLPMELALPKVVEVAFTAGALAREQRWLNLLHRLYAPLQLLPQQSGSGSVVVLRSEGLDMLVPATGGLGARLLVGRSAGLKLFSPQDAAFTQSLCDLLDRAAGERDAYVRGVEQERSRIARDLHDELGAKLLTALHGAGDQRQRALLEDAMAYMRLIACGLDQAGRTADDFFADLRYDTSQRLQRAGLQFDWQLDASAVHRLDLDARHQYQIHALVHEAVSNSMRHAVASRVSISLRCEHGHLHLCIGDDGAGFDPTQVSQGQGLRNMRARAQALGGEVHWRSRSVLAQDRTTTTMSTPGVGTLVEISWPVLQRTG